MDRVDHQPQRGINERARLLRIEVLHQFHRALDIGKQPRDGLALALGNFALFARGDGNAVRRGDGGGQRLVFRRRAGTQRRTTITAESLVRGIFRVAA